MDTECRIVEVVPRMKIPSIFKNIRVIILIIAIVLSVIAINPTSQEGVAVRFVEKNSAAYQAGMLSPEKNSRPLDHEVITHINGKAIENIEQYYEAVENLEFNRTVRITTDEKTYSVKTLPLYEEELTGNIVEEKREVTEGNETINKTFMVNETIQHVVGTDDLGLTIYDAPTNNLKKGLDLQGGVRVLLEPEEDVSEETLDAIVENLNQRLNAFGLNDVVIRKSGDLSGNRFILVEIAGLQTKEIEDLLASQGKFEAKIDDTVVFRGGGDIAYICRTSDCSGLKPQNPCGRLDDETYVCSTFFSIDIDPEAAIKFAEATKDLDIIKEDGREYLSSEIRLYLDDESFSNLSISSGLKGRAETQISISGSGIGKTRDEAYNNAIKNMKKMQAVLQTGSLPVKLEIVKADNLSPILGKEFLRTAIITGLVALLGVAAVILIRYRTLKIVLPAIFTSLIEVVILLGVAAMFGTNLDLAAIAGIIIVVGTGVDHLIVISDEIRKGEENTNLKSKIKNAFFIIMAAFFTTVVAMIPLVFAGAGILRGFALTTIYGVSIGVLITRPAYAAIVENLLK